MHCWCSLFDTLNCSITEQSQNQVHHGIDDLACSVCRFGIRNLTTGFFPVSVLRRKTIGDRSCALVLD